VKPAGKPLAVLLAVLTIPQAVRAENDSGSHIAAAALLERIEADDAPPVVDVRSRGEFERGHVPGAVHIPFWAIPGRRDEIPAAEMVVVYCEHGPRAGLAKAILEIAGFEGVVTLEGHMSGWKKAGLPQEHATPP